MYHTGIILYHCQDAWISPRTEALVLSKKKNSDLWKHVYSLYHVWIGTNIQLFIGSQNYSGWKECQRCLVQHPAQTRVISEA